MQNIMINVKTFSISAMMMVMAKCLKIIFIHMKKKKDFFFDSRQIVSDADDRIVIALQALLANWKWLKIASW